MYNVCLRFSIIINLKKSLKIGVFIELKIRKINKYLISVLYSVQW